MNPVVVIPALASALLGAVLLLLPHFSPRRFFFGITVPPDFRHTEEAHAALRHYHTAVAIATVAAVAASMLVLPPVPVWIWPLIPLAQVAGAASAFVRERNRLRRFAGAPVPAAPHPDDGRLPAWIGLAAVPFAVLLAVGLWLRAHWNDIPARFPIHWGLHGEPNGWADKTVRGVYGPLLFGAGLSLLLLMLALGTYYGSRPSRMRRPMLAILISATWVLSYAFGMVALLPLVRFGPPALMLPILAYVVAVIAWSFKLNAESEGEDTPDDRWLGGGIYYNPADPAIFVQKRIGVGYTINFGNHRSWLYLGLFAAGILGLVFLLPR